MDRDGRIVARTHHLLPGSQRTEIDHQGRWAVIYEEVSGADCDRVFPMDADNCGIAVPASVPW